MDRAWIEQVLAEPVLRRMGHAQRPEAADPGLGWLYYALARVERPERVVCIGSWRGFVPLMLGRALQDNGNGGRLLFIDPSLVDDFWRDPAHVQAWFARFGLHNVEHQPMTTQQFVTTARYAALEPVGLLFVDGLHTAEQARFDHEAFVPKLVPAAPVLFHDGLHTAEQARFDHEAFVPKLVPAAPVLFHDAVRYRRSKLYGADKAYEHDVVDYMAELRQCEGIELTSFEQDSGVVLVRDRRGDPGPGGR